MMMMMMIMMMIIIILIKITVIKLYHDRSMITDRTVHNNSPDVFIPNELLNKYIQ
jgi:hypothetical protein